MPEHIEKKFNLLSRSISYPLNETRAKSLYFLGYCQAMSDLMKSFGKIGEKHSLFRQDIKKLEKEILESK